jgi:hypothetical protein
MRIASSPTLRITAGLLLAALLSIVGYQVFRRWISHGPEALLERADAALWRKIRPDSPQTKKNIETARLFKRFAFGRSTTSRSRVHLFHPLSVAPVSEEDSTFLFDSLPNSFSCVQPITALA